MLQQETAKDIVQKYIEDLPFKVDEAILFGSGARGDRFADSDIDLIVISEDFKQMGFPQRFLVLQKNWKSKTDLEAFGFTREEFDKLKTKSIVIQEATEYGIRFKPRQHGKRQKGAQAP